uniref:Glucose-6-phosphate 1-dehydrogenase n=1 Tax=Rhizophora mucronata TaxID=61149 RepID=A0A2P2LJD5_RHIMU
MATHFSSCNFSPSSSSLRQERKLVSRLIVVPRKSGFSTWVSRIHSRIHGKKHFQLKSSNGRPLNAVSLQDGQFLLPLYLLSHPSVHHFCGARPTHTV